MNPHRIAHRSNFRKLFLFLCCCGTATAFAQPEPYNLREIPMSQEARHPPAFCMATDVDGLIWLGSLHGLLRFDGASLTTPHSEARVPPVKIQLLLKSRQRPENLWLGTVEQGLCLFNTKTEDARNFRFEPDNPGSLAGDAVAGLTEDAEGRLWVGTDNFTLNKMAHGAARFERFSPSPPPGEQVERSDWLGEIVQDTRDQNFLWVGCKFGVYRFDKRSREFRLFPFEKTEGFWYIPLAVQLHMDGDGTLWAGSFRTGLMRLNQDSGDWEQWKRWPESADLYNSNTIYEILPLDADRLLMSASREGLWWFDKKKKELGWLPDYRAVSGISKLNPGRDGADRFLVSSSTGLMLLTAEPPLFPRINFQQLNLSLTKNNWQRAYLFSPGKDTLYMGTMHGDGLLMLDVKSNQLSAMPYRKNTHPSGTDVLFDELCLDENGRLWMGTDEGLLFLNKTSADGGWSIEPFRSSSLGSQFFDKKHIQALACIDGWLWAGSKNDGLYRIRLSDGQTEHVQAGDNGLPDNHIRKIFVDKKGRAWVGSDRGLSLFDNDEGVFSKIQQVSGPVTDMEEISTGSLWVATLGSGLQLFDPERQSHRVFRNDGTLGADVIFDLKTAQDGRVWMHTQGGLAIFDPVNGLFENYDMRDNMPPKYGSLEELPDGHIVSAANLGYDVFSPDFGKTMAGRTPKPYLKSLNTLNSSRSWSLPFQQKTIEVAHDENHLAFEMGAIWLDANPTVYFEYKLEGFDPDWVFAGSRSFVSFNSLKPGHYRFKFRVGSRPGMWSLPTEAVEVIIHPAFYQTIWFKGLIFMVLAGIFVGAWLLKMRRVRREERMQATFDRRLAEVRHDALRAQMNPHFLSNCLNAIQWFIIKNRSKEAFDYLTKFSRLVRSVLDHSQRQRITVSEELRTLQFYLDMEAIRFENQFETHLDIDPHLDLEVVLLPPMLLQPLVENAIRHGLLPAERPGLLTVSVAGGDSTLICTVEDNGIGRAAAAQLRDKSIDSSPSQGLRLATERLAMMNGKTSLVFHDLFDENGMPAGTKVVLTLPLEK